MNISWKPILFMIIRILVATRLFFIFQVGDFVLVELQLQEGKHSGTPVCYVARVKALLEGDLLELKFLRLNNPPIKDTFTFPPNDDIDTIAVGQVKGVLDILTRSTARQANLVKVKHPLVTFNVK